MKHRWLCLLSGSFLFVSAACGDADGGLTDVALPDGEVRETSDAAGEVAGPDAADDTSAPDDAAEDTSEPGEVRPDTADDTAADTTEDAVETAQDATDEIDTIEDVGPGDGDVPECVTDADCPAISGIVPVANACVVARCVEGACVAGDRDCDDGDACTLDACDPHGGCVNTEVVLDVGASRYWYCPEAMFQADAAAACILRGQELATIDDADEGIALSPLLGDAGAPEAWTGSASLVTCPLPKRVAPPQCKSLVWAEAASCTDINDCAEALPFLCEARCDDGDPCTTDVVVADGTCETKTTICDDGDACTTDSCMPGVGCVFDRPRGQCVDANPCTTDRCDPATGVCSNVPVRRAWDATHELLECPGADTWTAARNWCAVNGGVLATPTTDTQASTLSAFAASPGVSASLWAPLEQPGGGAAAWTWVDGGGNGEPPWCAGQPDDASGSEDCGAWLASDACLQDAACGEVRSFGCAIDTTIP